MTININPGRKGLLHKNLGIPQSKPIPLAKMQQAKATASPAVKKRIVFAENARKWSHPDAPMVKMHTPKHN